MLFNLQILPPDIKGLAGSLATFLNWFTAWAITVTANLLLNWSPAGQYIILFFCYQKIQDNFENM